ncbi:wall-associated receptor kinase-like 20 [Carica papaya]|uniref:wall-associated receptor kinase-like 20 n=1 Tax=Carica papaya TaxID=3649 RepID=UPI000B8D01AB|nr:wall-associated receptor kinase-like 20 [Carica papaya]
MKAILIVSVFIIICNVSALDACPKCGKTLVPYPLSTDENCGNPSYKVYCNNNILQFLSADGFFYDILTIDPDAFSLVISPPLLQKNSCYSADLSSGGFKLDENLPFNISSRNTVMLFNCSTSILLSPLNCSTNSICRDFERSEMGSGCTDTLCCHYKKDASMTAHRIRIRLGGCTSYTCIVDAKPGDPIESWNYGIELQWSPPFSSRRQ